MSFDQSYIIRQESELNISDLFSQDDASFFAYINDEMEIDETSDTFSPNLRLALFRAFSAGHAELQTNLVTEFLNDAVVASKNSASDTIVMFGYLNMRTSNNEECNADKFKVAAKLTWPKNETEASQDG